MSEDLTEPAEVWELPDVATAVVVATEHWLAEGLCPATALALTQNALPLADGAEALSRLQARSHARVVAALLLLIDDEDAGELATRLVETLATGSAATG
ncbi:hypothetical protein [Actinomycetospora termitidis]|uniref:hypothetical protein n=1 Tax=Actinomycetospora termitidis TaxID=3053470 RepID=UPI00256F55A6|nr:hypothetical protein [Actinomycetospora sp. Odt1-22]